MSGRLMIYGATGYTGELVTREAVRRGLDPVVAGGNGEKLGRLAAELGVQSLVFGLADHDSIVRSLDGVSVVLNVAGPFGATAGPLLTASIAAGAHYLDTTAELARFLLAESLNEDLVTAWHSTKIPNIEVYIHNGIPLPDLAEGMELPDGPSAQERSIGRSRVAAEVVGSDGTTVRGLVDTPTGYTFTQLASVEIAARVLNGSFTPGFQSPSSAYGPDLVPSIADSHFIDL